MAVTPEEVRRIAALAMLRVDDAELDTMTGQLNTILDLVDALADVDVAGEEGTAELESAPLRPDEPGPDPLAVPPAAGAPGWDVGYFTVPRLSSHDLADAGAESEPEVP